MAERVFQPGDQTFAAEDAPGGQYSAVFEDDGETGYFYPFDLARQDNMIRDAIHIYNVASVADKDRPSTLAIVWSKDCLKCALLIDGCPYAAFDFATNRGFCRAGLPEFRTRPKCFCPSSSHTWSDEAVAWL